MAAQKKETSKKSAGDKPVAVGTCPKKPDSRRSDEGRRTA
jgi:hypothetical protein